MLVSAVREALAMELSWELVLVDDGSRDATARIAAELAAADCRVRLVRLARNYGQTQAMQAGFDAARGQVLVTMDGDLQNDPEDIGALLKKLDEGYEVVYGFPEQEQHGVLRDLASVMTKMALSNSMGAETARRRVEAVFSRNAHRLRSAKQNFAAAADGE